MKTALVTGATRGAGRAIAMALAMAGWRTYALGRDRAVLDEMRAGCGVQPLAMDLTDRDDLRVIASDMRLDTLIHAPLRWPREGRFVDLREAEIDMALEVNLSATMHLTHAILPSMITARSGHIVLISPGVSSGVSPDRSLVRATVGSAVAAFADGLRGELASSGVTVQTLDPGIPPFEDMAESLVKSLEERGLAGLSNPS